MKKLDRLILKEIVGPWVFGVGLFSALLMAGTYLNKIADYVVRGAPPSLIVQLTALLFPAIVVKTFTMAVLLAALLAFGRLSSDSEIVALKAGGASVFRIVWPVTLFSFFIAVGTFAFNEIVVPPAAFRAKELIAQLADTKSNAKADDPISFPIVQKGALQGFVMAKSSALTAGTLHDVTVVTYGKDGKASYYLEAPEMQFQADKEGIGNWHVRGSSRLVSADGKWTMTSNEAWPDTIARPTISPFDLILASNNDPDIISMREVAGLIERGRSTGKETPARLANLEYWYWSKISVPLAALIFGTLGAVLGIRNHRTGTAAGFALAVAIIFGYITLANFMSIWAQGGVLLPWMASFAPVLIGLVASGIIMVRRNT